MAKKYKKIILYGSEEDYLKLKERLGGIPVSVWFRHKVQELLKSKEKINL